MRWIVTVAVVGAHMGLAAEPDISGVWQAYASVANRDELNVVRNGFPPESASNDLLVFEITVTDPVLYREPQRITMYYQRIPDDEFVEYDCTAGLWYDVLRGVIPGRE